MQQFSLVAVRSMSAGLMLYCISLYVFFSPLLVIIYTCFCFAYLCSVGGLFDIFYLSLRYAEPTSKRR